MAYLLSRETPTPESDTQAKLKAVQRQAKSDSISIPPQGLQPERDKMKQGKMREKKTTKSNQNNIKGKQKAQAD